MRTCALGARGAGLAGTRDATSRAFGTRLPPRAARGADDRRPGGEPVGEGDARGRSDHAAATRSPCRCRSRDRFQANSGSNRGGQGARCGDDVVQEPASVLRAGSRYRRGRDATRGRRRLRDGILLESSTFLTFDPVPADAADICDAVHRIPLPGRPDRPLRPSAGSARLPDRISEASLSLCRTRRCDDLTAALPVPALAPDDIMQLTRKSLFKKDLWHWHGACIDLVRRNFRLRMH